MAKQAYIQIGITAARDPETGAFLPAVPIYAEATPELVEHEKKVTTDIAKLFAGKMKQYIDEGRKIERRAPNKSGCVEGRSLPQPIPKNDGRNEGEI